MSVLELLAWVGGGAVVVVVLFIASAMVMAVVQSARQAEAARYRQFHRRIAQLAKAHGMVTMEDVRILHNELWKVER